MARPALEVADIFRNHGPAWRYANRGHVSVPQLKAMSAIEDCRTAVLGGHVTRCENAICGHDRRQTLISADNRATWSAAAVKRRLPARGRSRVPAAPPSQASRAKTVASNYQLASKGLSASIRFTTPASAKSKSSAVAIPRSADITDERHWDPLTVHHGHWRRDGLRPTIARSTRRAVSGRKRERCSRLQLFQAPDMCAAADAHHHVLRDALLHLLSDLAGSRSRALVGAERRQADGAAERSADARSALAACRLKARPSAKTV